MLNGLDLFSGIGGISLALRDWIRPIAYCEIDHYCQGVLLSRMATGDLPTSPIWDDVRSFPAKGFSSRVDIITGGFPCQDISVAGRGKGLEGERSGLFFEILRLAKEIQPKLIFLENVPAITSRGGCTVTREIAALGYDCRWCVISAASIGALHRRERWFLLAHAKHNGTSTSKDGKGSGLCDETGRNELSQDTRTAQRASSLSEHVAISSNTDSLASGEADQESESITNRRQTWGRPTGQHWPFRHKRHWQEVVGRVCRTSDGVPNQVDRLKSLGNAVVPQQVKAAFKILMGMEDNGT